MTSKLAPFAARTFAVVASALCLGAAAQARPIQVAVIGDSVANDLGRGMEDLFADNRRFEVVKQTKFATGLVRTDYYDWNAVVRGFLAKHKPDAIFVVIGGNDRQPIRTAQGRFDPLTAPWLAQYERRVAHFMDTLARAHATVYWVGLPAVRSQEMTRDYAKMNRIFRREAARHHFKYVSIWDQFLKDGAYSSFGQSLEGVRRQLRMEDGMHFTEPGRLMLARTVAHAAGWR